MPLTIDGIGLRRPGTLRSSPAPEVPATPTDISVQFDIAFRLVLSAVLGGVIGIERELNDHPAGMRTHLLVSLGSAIFTVLSIYAFQSPPGVNGAVPTDPSRIAAQVVSGIGFLGAGAILKYGTTVTGLTTAASLWATASIGMAAAAGAWLVAIVGTAIILASLGPLRWMVRRLRKNDQRVVRLQLGLHDLEDLGPVMTEVHRRRLDVVSLETERLGKGRYEVHLRLAMHSGSVRGEIIDSIGAMRGITVVSAD
jgi:putative Mg2+ transporter-C (MgtC) family protein